MGKTLTLVDCIWLVINLLCNISSTLALVISKYTCRNGDNDDIIGNDDIINEAVIVLIEVLHI